MFPRNGVEKMTLSGEQFSQKRAEKKTEKSPGIRAWALYEVLWTFFQGGGIQIVARIVYMVGSLSLRPASSANI